MADNEIVHVLLVEDNEATGLELKKALRSRKYASFNVEWAKTFAEATEALKAFKESISLILTDYELDHQATGVAVYDAAIRMGISATIAMYSSHPSVNVPSTDAYAPLRANIWQPDQVLDKVRTWFDQRRRCAISSDGRCLWGTRPIGLRLPARGSFYYLSAPYDEDFQFRHARVMELFRKTGLSCEVTMGASFHDALDHIVHAIRDSRFVVVDLDQQRPNVTIEVGIALALEKQMLLLFPEGQTPPFNVSRAPAIGYSSPLWTDKTILLKIDTWLRKAGLVGGPSV